jgi:nicotinamidase/pyrazinamidase
MTKEALFAVDPEKDFFPGGALGVQDGDKIINPINEAVKYSREKGIKVMASRDWHPKETKHFNKWPVHGVQDTEGAKFHPDLDLEGVMVFSKGMSTEDDGYSAFDGINDTGQSLEKYLLQEGVHRLVLAGLATDYCVKSTGLDALTRGFEVVVLTDAIKPVNLKPEDGKRALEEMKVAGARFMTSKEFISGKK